MKKRINRAKALFSVSDLSSRLRGFVLDSQLPDAHEISEILGATIISDEVAEKEEEESDKRLKNVAYLVPLIYSFSKTLIEGAVTLQRETFDEADKIPETIWEANQRSIEALSLANAVAITSQLVDMGLLEIPKGIKKLAKK